MKALSIRQPWAWLIVNGIKDVENRTWTTTYRGPIIVHAGQRWDEGFSRAELDQSLVEAGFAPPDHIDRGGIVGIVEITGVVVESTSDWFSGPYGFTLSEPFPLPFVAYPGQLNLFDIPADVLRRRYASQVADPLDALTEDEIETLLDALSEGEAVDEVAGYQRVRAFYPSDDALADALYYAPGLRRLRQLIQ